MTRSAVWRRIPAVVLCRKSASATAIGLAGGTDDLHPETGAALLHLGGPDLDVQRAGGEQRLPQRLEIFRTQIIDVGGEQDDFARLGRRLAPGSAEAHWDSRSGFRPPAPHAPAPRPASAPAARPTRAPEGAPRRSAWSPRPSPGPLGPTSSPSSSMAVAGAGTGITPWAARTQPLPTATGRW